MTRWYTVEITGGPIYPAVVESIRHFCLVEPLPGAPLVCGATLGAGPYDREVLRTCAGCGEIVAGIRRVDPPEPVEMPTEESLNNLIQEAIDGALS